MDGENPFSDRSMDFEDLSWPWDLQDYAPIASFVSCEVNFLNVHPETVVYKYQSRVRKEAKQRLKNAIVDIKVTSTHQVDKINAWMERESKAADLFGYDVGRVPFAPRDIVHKEQICNEQTVFKDLYSIDLDSIYYDNPTNKRPVYKLAKTDMLNRNRFQLIVQLVFLDQSKSKEFKCPPFYCRTQPKHGVENTNIALEIQSSQDTSRPTSSDNVWHRDREVTKHRFLMAEEAVIGKLDVDVFTQRGDRRDIAYHFPLQDSLPKDLEEGDLVGLVNNSGDNPSLKVLTSSNFGSAFQIGVVSRSAFFEGNIPTDKSCTTDKICMLGIVEVKVCGVIQAGERVYASAHFVGKAVAESHPLRSNEERLIGIAMGNSANKDDMNKMQLVKCFVSFFVGVTSDFLHSKTHEFHENTKTVIEKSVNDKINRIIWVSCGYMLLFAFLMTLLFCSVFV